MKTKLQTSCVNAPIMNFQKNLIISGHYQANIQIHILSRLCIFSQKLALKGVFFFFFLRSLGSKEHIH